jgi:hypothetical protein
MGHFEGFFEGTKVFFILNRPERNLGIKTVVALSKNSSKWPIMCFAGEKKISRTFRISGTLVFLCFFATPCESSGKF